MVRGEGVFLYDHNGKQYLDACAGVGVVTIGHGVKRVIDDICEQMRKVSFVYSATAVNEPQISLANELAALAPKGMGKVRIFFCSGGSEANETALKLARQYFLETGKPNKLRVIARWQSYHGNTFTTLSMSGRTSWREKYLPYMRNFPHISAPNCYWCPYNMKYPDCNLMCARELERVIEQEGPESIAAFIAEPIIGWSASAVTPPAGYYELIREICDKYDVMLIMDEVVTGVGRTGTNFAVEHWGFSPDIITLAKGFSGGYGIIAAVIASENVWTAIERGSGHFSQSFTFMNNPVSCAAALSVLRYIKDNDLISYSKMAGDKFLRKLKETLQDISIVGEIRGKGLLLGIELVQDRNKKVPFPNDRDVAGEIAKKTFDDGVILVPGVKGTKDGKVGDHIILTPPYVINNKHIDRIVDSIRKALIDTEQAA